MAVPYQTEEARAGWRRARGIEREEEVVRDSVNRPHPSRGGSRGYPLSERLRMLEYWKDGHPVPASMVQSIRRWEERVLPYRMTGNKATGAMSGPHLLLLVVFKLAYPQASGPECAVFIAVHSTDGAVFTESEICKALNGLDYTRKVGSTTAYQAFTEVNLLKHHSWWNDPWPAGIVGTPLVVMIDADEAGFVIDDANMRYGHAVKGLRVRKPGNYGRGLVKITLILAIEPGNPMLPPVAPGSVQNPRRWWRASTDVGTTVEVYKDFIREDMINKFPPNEPQRTIMHDNLNSHKDPSVGDMIEALGHRVICRPPYRPHDGPIEWAIDQVACEVRRRWRVIKNERELIEQINCIIPTLSGFDALFRNCGYPVP